MLTSNKLRRIAKQLIEMADELDAAPPSAPQPSDKATPPPTAKDPAQRVLDALQRAPSYAHLYPAFGQFLNAHAMTRTQITRALGNGPGVSALVKEALDDLVRLSKVKRVDASITRLPGRKPEIYVLPEFAHVFEAPVSTLPPEKKDINDPFAKEWIPPWRQ